MLLHHGITLEEVTCSMNGCRPGFPSHGSQHQVTRRVTPTSLGWYSVTGHPTQSALEYFYSPLDWMLVHYRTRGKKCLGVLLNYSHGSPLQDTQLKVQRWVSFPVQKEYLSITGYPAWMGLCLLGSSSWSTQCEVTGSITILTLSVTGYPAGSVAAPLHGGMVVCHRILRVKIPCRSVKFSQAVHVWLWRDCNGTNMWQSGQKGFGKASKLPCTAFSVLTIIFLPKYTNNDCLKYSTALF